MDYAVVVFIISGAEAFVSSGYETGTIPSSDDVFKQNAVDIHGGVLGDYAVYRTSDSAIMDRIFNGDDYVGILSGSTVTSLDFSAEDAKLWIKFGYATSATGMYMEYDGTLETLNLTCNMLEADGVTLDGTFNGNITIDVLDPLGNAIPYYIEFSDGEASFTMKPWNYGTYYFPLNPIRYATYRVKVQIPVSVYYKVV